jgi:hypothetical protein
MSPEIVTIIGDRFYEQILGYAAIVVAVGPFLAWLVYVVVPSWV